MPSSPTTPGSTTNSASPEKINSSALTTSTWMVLAMVSPLLRGARALAAGAPDCATRYCSVFAFSNASSMVPTM